MPRTKESGKFPTEAEQAAWWAGYSTSEQAVEALLAERDALREALKRIEDNAESWHGDNEAKARALAVIAGWCREALERTP